MYSSSGLLTDPSINIEVSVSGKQSLSGFATEDLQNSTSALIKIISDVGFTGKVLYYSGPFTNHGLIPPKVEKETTYTVVWTISNTANNISQGLVQSSLPSWVRFVGPISPSTEDLVYNPSTKQITWNVGRVPKGAGILGAPREVAFQIGFTPSLSQVRTTPTIINDAVLTAHDDFANVNVKVNKAPLRTDLNSDTTFPAGGGIVVE